MAEENLTYTYQAAMMQGGSNFVVRSGSAFVPCDLDNMDYQAFLAWMAEGNPAPAGWTGPTNSSPSTG